MKNKRTILCFSIAIGLGVFGHIQLNESLLEEYSSQRDLAIQQVNANENFNIELMSSDSSFLSVEETYSLKINGLEGEYNQPIVLNNEISLPFLRSTILGRLTADEDQGLLKVLSDKHNFSLTNEAAWTYDIKSKLVLANLALIPSPLETDEHTLNIARTDFFYTEHEKEKELRVNTSSFTLGTKENVLFSLGETTFQMNQQVTEDGFSLPKSTINSDQLYFKGMQYFDSMSIDNFSVEFGFDIVDKMAQFNKVLGLENVVLTNTNGQIEKLDSLTLDASLNGIPEQALKPLHDSSLPGHNEDVTADDLSQLKPVISINRFASEGLFEANGKIAFDPMIALSPQATSPLNGITSTFVDVKLTNEFATLFDAKNHLDMMVKLGYFNKLDDDTYQTTFESEGLQVLMNGKTSL